jgi:hypothetical protein
MRFGILFAWLFTLQASSASVFEVELWPGEGRPVFVAVGSQLSIRELPSDSSSITSTLAVSPGQKLAFDETRYITTTPGRFRVLEPTSVTGRLLGDLRRLSRADYYSGKFDRGSVSVVAGSDIEYLQYRAEGTCFVRVVGQAIDADPCPTQEATKFRLDAQPIVEWWIRVVSDSAGAGWLHVSETTVKVSNREF